MTKCLQQRCGFPFSISVFSRLHIPLTMPRVLMLSGQACTRSLLPSGQWRETDVEAVLTGAWKIRVAMRLSQRAWWRNCNQPPEEIALKSQAPAVYKLCTP